MNLNKTKLFGLTEEQENEAKKVCKTHFKKVGMEKGLKGSKLASFIINSQRNIFENKEEYGKFLLQNQFINQKTYEKEISRQNKTEKVEKKINKDEIIIPVPLKIIEEIEDTANSMEAKLLSLLEGNGDKPRNQIKTQKTAEKQTNTKNNNQGRNKPKSEKQIKREMMKIFYEYSPLHNDNHSKTPKKDVSETPMLNPQSIVPSKKTTESDIPKQQPESHYEDAEIDIDNAQIIYLDDTSTNEKDDTANFNDELYNNMHFCAFFNSVFPTCETKNFSDTLKEIEDKWNQLKPAEQNTYKLILNQ